MSILTSGTIAKALLEGVNSFSGLHYKNHPKEYEEIFKVHQSEKNFEEDVILSGFGLGAVVDEGASLSYDSMRQAFVKRYTHVKYANGFVVTEEHIEDNLYAKLAKQKAQSLVNGMVRTKETVCANILNRAFSASYQDGADGLELCSTAHVLGAGGTHSNELSTPLDLSEAALEDMCIAIDGFVDERGLQIAVKPMKLIIPKELRFDAARILESEKQPDVFSNNVNALRKHNVLPEGYAINHYLTDADAFFILTSENETDGLKLFQRKAFMVQHDTADFDTDNIKIKGKERYSVGWTGWRCIFGSEGAA